MFDAKHLLGALMGTGFGGANQRPGFGGGGLFDALGQAMQQGRGGGLGGLGGGTGGGAGGILDAIGGMTGGGRGAGLAAVAGLAGLLGAGGKLGKGVGLATLGGLALHALQTYQERQGEGAALPGAPATSPAASVSEGDAVLLIRAMVAAANADGRIDEDEQRRIEQQLEKAAVSEEERAFLAQELSRPAGVEEIARETRTPELAQQVYAASLLAMTADTPAEQSYLRYLADRVGLSAEDTAAIHRQLGA
jgi:uncharacterized membrane protein YebE (DUF533 family)